MAASPARQYAGGFQTWDYWLSLPGLGLSDALEHESIKFTELVEELNERCGRMGDSKFTRADCLYALDRLWQARFKQGAAYPLLANIATCYYGDLAVMAAYFIGRLSTDLTVKVLHMQVVKCQRARLMLCMRAAVLWPVRVIRFGATFGGKVVICCEFEGRLPNGVGACCPALLKELTAYHRRMLTVREGRVPTALRVRKDIISLFAEWKQGKGLCWGLAFAFTAVGQGGVADAEICGRKPAPSFE
jgi:hypothetical protein